MRGLAIALVVLYHATTLSGFQLQFPLWPQPALIDLRGLSSVGFLGVEVFFFVSGFVICAPYVRWILEGAPRPSLREYAWRRFIKIVPSYLLVLCAASWWAMGVYPDLPRQVLAHALFLHGFWIDTFGSLSGSFWTLSIEVQFYVLFPILIVVFRRWPIATWVALVTLANVYRMHVAADRSYIYMQIGDQLPAQLDVFGSGMLGAYLYTRFRPAFAASEELRGRALLCALAGLAAGALLFRGAGLAGLQGAPFSYYLWEMYFRTPFSVAVLALTVGSALSFAAWRGLVANPLLTWLSVISYNLYLWHELVIKHCLSWKTICSTQPLAWRSSAMTGLQYFLTLLVISIAIATAVTYGFERPLLRWRPAFLRRSKESGAVPGSAAVARP